MKLRVLGATSAAVLLALCASPTIAQEDSTTNTATAEPTEDDGGFDDWGLLGLLGLAGLIPRKRKDDHHRTDR
jgi:hypothetical protein